MSFESRLSSVTGGDNDASALGELARSALAEGEEERALPLVSRAARQQANARLWQWTGLLQRALDEHETALASFAEAARLAPTDASIAQGRAHVALEAGLNAVSLFENAVRLASAKGEALIGLAAARTAVGRGEEAAAELGSILSRVPLWLQGHAQFAQLQSTLGRREAATGSLDAALAVMPHEPQLWRALFELHLRGEDYADLQASLARAASAGVAEAWLVEYAAIAASEGDEGGRAEDLFARAPEASQPKLALWRIRHLLRSGRFA